MEYQDLIEKLWDAVDSGDVDETINLVKQGAWPNHIRTGDGLQANALHLAAMKNHVELIDILVRLGADVHIVNAQGMTALHMAAQLGNLESVKMLISLGSDPLFEDWMKDTPLDKAILAEQEEVAGFLRSVIEGDRQSLLAFNQNVRHVVRRQESRHFVEGKHTNPLLANL